jgi:NAD(P)H-dependent FMN reductase
MKFVIIYGTNAAHGRLWKALEAFEAALQACNGLNTAIVDLHAESLPWADGTPVNQMPPSAQELVSTIASANAFVLFSPIYRASIPGSLKNMLDLLPLETLEAKPVGLVAMGGSAHHYGMLDFALAPILSWFGAIPVPNSPYLTTRSFDSGVLTSDTAQSLSDYAGTMVAFAKRLDGVKPQPRPLAANF